MCIERYLRLVAGFIVLASLALSQLVSPWFLLLTGFVGLNLLQSAFTNWCPLIGILHAFRVAECAPRSSAAGPG